MPARTLTHSNPFLLGHCRQQGNHYVFECAAGIQVRLGETLVAHLVGGQALKILQRGKCPFACQSVERPEQQHIKFSLGRVEEHLLKLGARGDGSTFVTSVNKRLHVLAVGR